MKHNKMILVILVEFIGLNIVIFSTTVLGKLAIIPPSYLIGMSCFIAVSVIVEVLLKPISKSKMARRLSQGIDFVTAFVLLSLFSFFNHKLPPIKSEVVDYSLVLAVSICLLTAYIVSEIKKDPAN